MSRPSKTFLIISIFMICTVTLYYSCNRIDNDEYELSNNVSRFFKVPANTNPLVISLAGTIQRQHERQPFVGDFVKHAGFPIWDKAKVFTRDQARQTGRSSYEEGDQLVYIPFSKEYTNFIDAVLVAKIHTPDTLIKMLYSWQYADYGFGPSTDSTWNAKDILHIFTLLEKEAFNHTAFRLNDSRIVGGRIRVGASYTVKFKPSSDSPMARQSITSCDIYDVCVYPEELGDDGWCDGGNCTTSCEYWTNAEMICTTFWVDFGAGGAPDSGSPPSGGGGSGSWYANPCRPMPGTSNPCNGAQGWVPVSDEPPTNEPVDSLLRKYSLAINSVADSLLTLSLNNHNYEYFAAIVKKDGLIYTKNIKTDRDSMGVTPNYFLAQGEVLLGGMHTHPRASINERSAPSNGDIDGLRKNLVPNFTSFIECGNVRYALVITDVARAKTFFKNNSLRELYNSIYTKAMQVPGYFGNWQNATQVAVAATLGPATKCGISFFVSNNADKTSYTLLNQ